MLSLDIYKIGSKSFDVEIAPAPSGQKLPLVVVVHGNFGLGDPFGKELRRFTEELAGLGFVAALPSYYPRGYGNPLDGDIAEKVPTITAAINHLSGRADVDASRLGLVGFSLGGGICMAYINSVPPGTVRGFADFYGFVSPLLSGGVTKFPPTIVFHNAIDPIVVPSLNSEPLVDALSKAGIDHEPSGSSYNWYTKEQWERGGNHAFLPGGVADTDSRQRAGKWMAKYV